VAKHLGDGELSTLFDFDASRALGERDDAENVLAPARRVK